MRIACCLPHRKLWERFLELCCENGSFYGMTWSHLRSQLDGVELRKTYILNPLAPEFVPNRLRHGAYMQPQPIAYGRSVLATGFIRQCVNVDELCSDNKYVIHFSS